MTASERARNRGMHIKAMRQSADLTLEDMAFELGISRASVARMENGEYVPDLDEWQSLCNACHKNPVISLLSITEPELYASRNKNLSNMQYVLNALDDYLHKYASEHTRNELAFLVLGNHGSFPDAVIDLVTAYLQLPLYMRHCIAQMISSSYQEAKRMDVLNCPDSVQPDVDTLTRAIIAGTEASLKGSQSYNIGKE